MCQVYFRYTKKNKQKVSFSVSRNDYKEVLINLLEDLQFDKITDLYYTLDMVEHKADYYNG